MKKKTPTQNSTPETPEGKFYIKVTEAQCWELARGRLPEAVQEMARTLCDWTLETVGDNYEARTTNRRRRG